MKKIVFTGIWMACVLAGNAQEVRRVSATEALTMAEQNRKDIRNQAISESIAINEIAKINARKAPQVTASLDYRYNMQLQRSVLPAGTIRPDAPTIIPLGTKYNITTGVNASYDVFNPANRSDIKYAQKSIELEKANTQKAVVDVRQAVLQAYYDVLLGQEKVRFSSENLKRTEQYYQEGCVKYENRTILKSDLERLQLDMQNAHITYEEDRKNLQLSQLYLANQMGLEPEARVEASETLETILQGLPEVTNLQRTSEQRVEITQEKLKLEQNQLDYTRQNKAYWPTVSVFASWNAQHLNNNFGPFDANTWYPYSYVGLKVNATLFDGLQKERSKTEYRFRAEQNQNTLAKLQSDMNYEWESAKVELLNIREKLKTAQENYQLAQQIVQTDSLRFGEGKITAAELKNTEYSLATAQNNLMTSYYNLLVARLKYKKAIGEL
ncbi:TolC family protein [Cytophagaceae bacterium YF14B1]|uniref:TolC family protein n=1 Tax=Xanthocytophaga flava TaxID=3048013 RepID=A0AAE3U8Y9_9BACT|nr:TolC family protein [Xanthocytophaga flavus]MDJ1483137.1 TolC family protein [Xanthocytophaga flavus]